jgi:quinol monooxygenase YgiN
MFVDVLARFDARTGKRVELREELMRILEPTRAEAGCVGIHLYECLRGQDDFIIHSQWTEEAAFDAHAELPQMKRFLGLVGGADYASGAGDWVRGGSK